MMPRMIRRGSLFVLAAALALLVTASVATAALPAGPRLTFFEIEYVKKGSGSDEGEQETRLVSADANGHDRVPVLEGGSVEMLALASSWSAEGGEIAFLGRPAGVGKPDGRPGKSGEAKYRVYVADADGSELHAIPGTSGSYSALLSADGKWLAFTRIHKHEPLPNPKNPSSYINSLTHSYNSTSTWIVPVAGGKPRRLTPWENGRTSVPSSFSPDGSTLAVTVEQPGKPLRVDTIDLRSGKTQRLLSEAVEGVYSPDGSKIAFLSYRDHESVPGFDEPEGTDEVYVANADGSDLHRVSHTPKMQESEPTWDPSGRRLAFLRSRGGMLGFLFSEVVESNVDGSCAHVVATLEPQRMDGEGTVASPGWLPGEGRGAGPISC
jgi:Tol biopolymer transport system component